MSCLMKIKKILIHYIINIRRIISFSVLRSTNIKKKCSVSEGLQKISEGCLPTFILRNSLNGFQISHFLKEYYRLWVNIKDICEKLIINTHLLCSVITEKHHYIFRLSPDDSHIFLLFPYET